VVKKSSKVTERRSVLILREACRRATGPGSVKLNEARRRDPQWLADFMVAENTRTLAQHVNQLSFYTSQAFRHHHSSLSEEVRMAALTELQNARLSIDQLIAQAEITKPVTS